MLPSSGDSLRTQKLWSNGLLAATAVNCLFQVAWFWRFRAQEISMDGISYIGLARHIVDGQFKSSLHGYWSPLTSWLIAASSICTRDFTLLGRLVTIGSFLLCLPLLYVLTLKLWNSRVAAALATFWFSSARGMISLAVGSILADFVLTACILLYFMLLLGALRTNRSGSWVLVGFAHALAFLAKAISMPWLTIPTVLGALARNGRAPRRLVASVALAALFPAAIWLGWGATLRTKYGVFTSGYQLRQNLMINWHRQSSHYANGDGLEYVDASSLYDDYMVGEISWSRLQAFSFKNPGLIPMILRSEAGNIPVAIKEIAILLNPAGFLALSAMLLLLIRQRSQFLAEAEFAWIAVVSTVCVVLAYAMLVFDGRYVIPVTPVLIAIGCPLLLPGTQAGRAPTVPAWVQRTLLVLFVASTVFFAVYWSSPFRTVDRDFEVSCYQASNVLRGHKPQGTLVSIGNGPYPEHGVGFEAGNYVSYLAGWRMVGGNSALPDSPADTDALVSKALGSKSDTVIVWGSPIAPAYQRTVTKIEAVANGARVSKLSDPRKGEVGTLFLFAR